MMFHKYTPIGMDSYWLIEVQKYAEGLTLGIFCYTFVITKKSVYDEDQNQISPKTHLQSIF